MRALVAVALLSSPLLAPPAAAEAPTRDEPPLVKLAVGEAVDVCRLARCPASAVFCDDASLVEVEHGGTIRLRARKAGATICAIQQADTTRRVVRVVVEEGEAPRG